MRFQKTVQGYMVRLLRGEEVHAGVTRFMRERKIGGGSVTGLGAVTKVTLGHFDPAGKDYTRRDFPDNYELVSLNGNLGYVDGQPMMHAHVVIADSQMRPVAGHLFAATVAVTVELYITIADITFNRAYDEETGLKLLDLTQTL